MTHPPQFPPISPRDHQHTLGPHTFRVVCYPVETAVPLFFRVLEKIGSVGSGLDGDWGSAIRATGMTGPDAMAFINDVLAFTQVRSGDLWVPVTKSYGDPDLFMGPEGLERLGELVYLVVKDNYYGPLLSRKLAEILRAVARKMQATAARFSQVQSTASETSSGDDSRPSGTAGAPP